MAPKERPICDSLADNTATWEEKAMEMLDILREYYCMRTFYTQVELNEEQKEQMKKKKVMDESE